MLSALARLVEWGEVVVLSGAGISTESGIPDYRGTPGKTRRAPITYREFVSDPSTRRRYWARSHAGWRRIERASPNGGHEAVVSLERLGLLRGLVTQNVDGLHQAAGSEAIIELHGSLHGTVCLDCGDRRRRLELHHRLEAANPTFARGRTEYAPDGDAEIHPAVLDDFVTVDCLPCGGTLKPDVVFFGESVPSERVEAARRLVSSCRSLLVLGSSLAVMSGHRFVLAAHRLGLPIAIVNRGPTRGDPFARVRLDADLTATLTALVDRLAPARMPEAHSGSRLPASG